MNNPAPDLALVVHVVLGKYHFKLLCDLLCVPALSWRAVTEPGFSLQPIVMQWQHGFHGWHHSGTKRRSHPLVLGASGHVGQKAFVTDSTRSINNRSKEIHLSCYLMNLILIKHTHTHTPQVEAILLYSKKYLRLLHLTFQPNAQCPQHYMSFSPFPNKY